MTKASTFQRYTLMPTVWAAISLPRSATSVRPTREPSRLLARSWHSSATAPISQKYWVGVISSPPGSVGAGIAEMPIGPLVSPCQRFDVTSIMKPKASVTMARYGPLARNEGMASSAPATPGEHHADRRRDPEWPAGSRREQRGGVRADRVEAGVTERDLSRPPDQDVEPQRHDEEVGERLQDEDEERIREHERERQHNAPRRPRKRTQSRGRCWAKIGRRIRPSRSPCAP